MKQIDFLKPGSKIAIAAPARMVTPNEMQFAINWLKETRDSLPSIIFLLAMTTSVLLCFSII